MCDEVKLFGMLSRIDERTEIIQKQQDNIFDRLQKLEQKSPVCEYHTGLVNDVANLKTDIKIAGVKIVIITTIIVGFLTWLSSNISL